MACLKVRKRLSGFKCERLREACLHKKLCTLKVKPKSDNQNERFYVVTDQHEIGGLTRIFHTNHLRRPGRKMDAALARIFHAESS